MYKKEISREGLLSLIAQYQEQLQQDLSQVQKELEDLKPELKNCMERVRNAAIEQFLKEDIPENKERNQKIADLQKDLKNYIEAKERIEQTKTKRYGSLFSKITHPYWEKALEQTYENLQKRREEILEDKKQLLKTDFAQRWIDIDCRWRLRNETVFKDFMTYKGQESQIEDKLRKLEQLGKNIEKNERDNFIVVGNIGTPDNLIQRISQINNQLDTITVSIREFETMVDAHLKEVSFKYDEDIEKVADLAKRITENELMNAQKDIYNKEDKVIDYRRWTAIKKFQKEIPNINFETLIRNGQLEKLPFNVINHIRNTSEYIDFKQTAKVKEVIEGYKSQISKIPDSGRRIEIKNKYFSSFDSIIKSKSEIDSKIKNLTAGIHNLTDKGQTKNFDM
ncbi:MAG TPA: hypothetical protein PLZ08_06445 [Bacillota bacterium]|jgi:hypothetical protein|nr:hypothetical protein [Bacillota bacterium]HPO97583.1 hypothetical protein [Bacillota bacterium]